MQYDIFVLRCKAEDFLRSEGGTNEENGFLESGAAVFHSSPAINNQKGGKGV